MLYILDTDHISFLQRRNPHVLAKIARIAESNRAVTIITVVEQIQGRLAVIRRARKESDAARAFERLHEAINFYLTIRVLPYDAAAATEFDRLRRQKIRIGTQDLRIASIALSRNATVVTSNIRDFGKVPGLKIEDWSVPNSSDIVNGEVI